MKISLNANSILKYIITSMKKIISHFGFIGGVREFDTETGQVCRAVLANRNDTKFGSAWKQNGKWFVFHSDEYSLILQHKDKIWRVNSDYKVRLKGDVIRKFEIFKKDKKVFSIRYIPKGLLIRVIDPTYDGIDAEFDDFFLYIYNMWERWSERPYSEFR